MAAEDDMRRAPSDFPGEVVPGPYRAIANDPEACRAMAAEALDAAWGGVGSGRTFGTSAHWQTAG
jgi:hypothetical protein